MGVQQAALLWGPPGHVPTHHHARARKALCPLPGLGTSATSPISSILCLSPFSASWPFRVCRCLPRPSWRARNLECFPFASIVSLQDIVLYERKYGALCSNPHTKGAASLCHSSAAESSTCACSDDWCVCAIKADKRAMALTGRRGGKLQAGMARFCFEHRPSSKYINLVARVCEHGGCNSRYWGRAALPRSSHARACLVQALLKACSCSS